MENDPAYAQRYREQQEFQHKILGVLVVGISVAAIASEFESSPASGFTQQQWADLRSADERKRHEMERLRRERSGDFSMSIEP